MLGCEGWVSRAVLGHGPTVVRGPQEPAEHSRSRPSSPREVVQQFLARPPVCLTCGTSLASAHPCSPVFVLFETQRGIFMCRHTPPRARAALPVTPEGPAGLGELSRTQQSPRVCAWAMSPPGWPCVLPAPPSEACDLHLRGWLIQHFVSCLGVISKRLILLFFFFSFIRIRCRAGAGAVVW